MVRIEKDYVLEGPDGAVRLVIQGLERIRLLDFISTEPFLVARDDEGAIVGSLTLALFRTPTGARAWIEDVVVDEAVRGRGIGEDSLIGAGVKIIGDSHGPAVVMKRLTGSTWDELIQRRERQIRKVAAPPLGFLDRARDGFVRMNPVKTGSPVASV